jgi:hypothetical protein
MAKRHGAVERDESGGLRSFSRSLRDPKMLGGAPKKCRVSDRFGRSEEQQALCVSREREKSSREALLDYRGDWQCRRQAEAAGELAWGHAAWKLDQGEWIPTSLGDDPFEHRFVEARHDDRLQQRPCIAMAEWLHLQLRKARKVTAGIPSTKDECDPLGEQSASYERERLGGSTVEPLRVVDHAEERLSFGGFRQQAENSEPDKQWARCLAAAQGEGYAERLAL